MSGSIGQPASAAGFCRRSAGYTIIESAIVMIVVGVMMASFASAYNIYLKTQQAQKTDNNASIVVNALDNYLIQTGAYPCPARANAVRADADYGIASDCTDATILPGTCSAGNGLCVELSNRLPALTAPRVRRGTVPFRTLGLPEDIAEDGYKTRFEYAVTESLAVATSYNQRNGGIDLQNQLGDSIQKPPVPTTGGSIHYLVIGKGPDKQGGFTRYGEQLSPCPAAGWDADNCNTGLVAPANLAIYRMAPYSTAVGADHFDDYIKFSSAVETPLWKIADTTGFHINDLIAAGPGPTDGKIGIGIPGAPSATLEVAGKVHVAADSHANELCPSGTPTSGCFTVAHDMPCATGYVSKIASGTVTCVPAATVPCPAGQVAYSLDASGNVLCRSLANCPVESKTLCSGTPFQTTVFTPTAFQGATWTTSPAVGYNFTRTYICNSSGTWATQSSNGICVCTPVNETYPITCNAALAGNWTGSGTQQHIHTCPANTDTYINDTSGCTCAPTTETSTSGCGSGFSGSITSQRSWTCGSATSGSWSSWAVTSNTCTCTPTSTTQNVSCPVAHTGTIVQQADWTCPAAAWSSWSTISNTCTCTGAIGYQTIGCVAPLTGSREQSRTYDCVADTWGPWTTYQDNCGSVVYTWRDVSTQTGPFGSALSNQKGNTCSPQGAVSPCSSAAGGGDYWHYTTCECQ